MTCRICYEDKNLVSVCGCGGTHKYVHLHCVQQWINVSDKNKCELCQQPFKHKNLKFMLTPPYQDQSIILFAALLGMIHGTITWLSLFENHPVELIFLETLICQLVVNAIVYISKYPTEEKWKPLCAFSVAFFVSNVPAVIFVPVRLYNYNLLVPCLANILVIYAVSCFYFYVELREYVHERCGRATLVIDV